MTNHSKTSDLPNLHLIVAFFSLFALHFLHAAGEPTPLEAATGAQTQAANSIDKWIESGTSTDPVLAKTLQTFQEANAKLTEAREIWNQAWKNDPEFTRLQQASVEASKFFNEIRKGGAAPDSKEFKSAQTASNKALAAVNNAKDKLKQPELIELEQLVQTSKWKAKAAVVDYRGEDPEASRLASTLASAKNAQLAARKADDASKGLIDPLSYIESQTPPVFAKNHTLPPLTRYGWVMPFDFTMPFAEHWGYSAGIEGYLGKNTMIQLENPHSDISRLIKWVQENPGKYKVSLTTDRYDPPNPQGDVWTRDADGNLLSTAAKSLDGTQWHEGLKTTLSTEAPDQYWLDAGEGRAKPIRKIQEMVPVSIVLNGGEWGLGVWGFAGPVWSKDPKIVAKINEYKAKGKTRFDYIDERAANAKKLVAKPVKEATPDRIHYVYYTAGGTGHRGRNPGYRDWGVTYEYSRGINEIPSTEYYVNHWNTGFDGEGDILTTALNARGQEIALGDHISYDWFWASKKNTDPLQYQGFLKCLYVTGSIGGNAGTYSTPDWVSSFPKDEPPAWIWQQMALGRVHGLFSHFEDFLRNGDLVDDGKFRNFFSTDQPAYELLPKELNNSRQLKPDLQTKNPVPVLAPGRPYRVLARKHRQKNEWLVVAWTSEVPDKPGVRDATVTIPGAGEVKLQARKGGSLYLVSLKNGQPVVKHLDPDEADPTSSFR